MIKALSSGLSEEADVSGRWVSGENIKKLTVQGRKCPVQIPTDNSLNFWFDTTSAKRVFLTFGQSGKKKSKPKAKTPRTWKYNQSVYSQISWPLQSLLKAELLLQWDSLIMKAELDAQAQWVLSRLFFPSPSSPSLVTLYTIGNVWMVIPKESWAFN